MSVSGSPVPWKHCHLCLCFPQPQALPHAAETHLCSPASGWKKGRDRVSSLSLLLISLSQAGGGLGHGAAHRCGDHAPGEGIPFAPPKPCETSLCLIPLRSRTRSHTSLLHSWRLSGGPVVCSAEAVGVQGNGENLDQGVVSVLLRCWIQILSQLCALVFPDM